MVLIVYSLLCAVRECGSAKLRRAKEERRRARESERERRKE